MLRSLTRIRLRLRSLFRRDLVDNELDDELQYHLEREVEARVAAGMSARDARHAARRSLGAVAQNLEECRDMRGVNVIDDRLKDFRFALRQLRKSPGFAVTAIVTLALGLAASVAILGFVDAALVRPLPYHDPSRLVTVFGVRPDLVQTQNRGALSYLAFLEWRRRNQVLSSIAAYDVRTGFTMTTAAGHERVRGLRVTSGFFSTLGVTPVIGREFRPDEEGPAAPPAVMLAHGTWQTRFGGRSDVLGTTVSLQGEPHVIIGILPPDFHFAMAAHADFWATIRGPQACWERPFCQSLETVARLGDDVSIQAASASLEALQQQIAREFGNANRDSAKVVPLSEIMVGDVRPIMVMLVCGVGLLLTIACINALGLVMARAENRNREIAVRHALGASTGRLALQFATEALVLVGVGCGLGLVLADWGMRGLGSLLSPDMISRMPYLQQIGLNLRLIVYAGAIAIVATAMLSLAPLVRASMQKRFGALKEGSRTASGMGWRRVGSYLVMAELTLTVILLVSAGLLGRSLYSLLHVETGFNPEQLIVVNVSPVGPGSFPAGSDKPGALAHQVAARVAALPGVRSVGYADLTPIASVAPTSVFHVIGRPPPAVIDSHPVRRVSAAYFTTLQARLLHGRYFTDEEVASMRHVLIINETAMRRYFPDEDPLGRAIAFGVVGDSSPARQIVGVVADIKDGPLEHPAQPAAYVPFDQSGFGLVVRTSQPERPLIPTVVSAIREMRSDILVRGETTMMDGIRRAPSAAMQRASAWLVGGFAGTALVLSLVGLYGVVSYSVGQRAREIAVRIALGARRGSVYRLIVSQTARWVGAGTVAGVFGALAAATLMRRLLFGVASWDPLTLVATVMVVTLSALMASFIPARRAASVDPIQVLRAE